MDERAATPPGHADYRYLLANERTFLSYVRTALALQVAGSWLGVMGYRRFRRNEATIRSGADMHTARTPALLALAVGSVPLVAALLITFT
jgi:uncharacterized membrane protein YidH (DUF202 family)